MQQNSIRKAFFALPLLSLALAVPCTVRAQVDMGPAPGNTTYTGTPLSGPRSMDVSNMPLSRSILHQREEARKVERHKRMVDSANRLVQLTQQFQADVKGRPLTPDDEKRLDEIARLARVVKEQMTGN